MTLINPHHEFLAREHIADMHCQAAQARQLRHLQRPSLLGKLSAFLSRQRRPKVRPHGQTA